MKKIIETIFGLVLVTASIVLPGCEKNHDNNSAIDNETTNSQNPAGESTISCGSIPSDLQPPLGNQLSLQAYAVGVQIYQVRRSSNDPAVISWVNIAPLANLYAKPDFTSPIIGVHYTGPTWEFTKGIFKDDKVVAAKSKGIIVDASAVPWLLLKAVDSLSSPKNKITWIQRVCTAGGLAPLRPATESNLGETDSIPYTATYRFFTKE